VRWAYSLTDNIEGAGSTPDAEVFAIFRGLFEGGAVPPELQAGIYRAMKEIPGVSVSTVDVLREPTLAVTLTDESLRQELLLDQRSYAYRGQRSTVTEDKIVSPEKAGNATGEIKKGHTVVVERIAAGIVDEAGEKP
jgi:hypothetical protein